MPNLFLKKDEAVINTILFLFIISCANKDKKTAAAPEVSIEPTFNCFNGPDTVMTGVARGCENRFYKLLDDHEVLQVEYKGEIQYDSCIVTKIDTIRYRGVVKMMLYEKGNAVNNYFCNDVGTAPEREIEAIGGTLYFRFYPPDKNNTSPHSYRVSIWAQDVEFWDDIRKVKTEVDNILYYKVPHWTWYGG
jgi:hypothetical protein